MDVIGPGITPGSDTAHLSLLGYDVKAVYTGRGPFEAAGAGIEILEGDVAFRCNFSTISSDGLVLDRRAGRIREGTKEMASALDGLMLEDIEVIFKAGVEHRGALVFRGPGLSASISDVDPHEIDKPVLVSQATTPEGEKTARILNLFVRKSQEILEEHPINIDREARGKKPANIILPRGGGVVPHILSMRERTGMSVAGVAGVTLVRGVCRAAGIELIHVPGATGGRDTDMMGKAEGAVKALQNHDMVLVNIKAPDTAGHDKEPLDKVAIIECIDKAVGRLLDTIPEGTVVALTADHSTPCSVGGHTGDPVPLAIFAEGNRSDMTKQYDEISCSHGGLGRIVGRELMPIMMNMAGRAEKYGA